LTGFVISGKFEGPWKGIAQCPESDETWQAIDAVASQQGKTFQKLADEAFKDLLKKHHQPVGLKAALKESIGARSKSRRGKS
jgi:hypothetical protein